MQVMQKPLHGPRARPTACSPARPGGAALAVLAALVAAVLVVTGCSDEPEPTVAAYCDEVRTNLDLLTAPALATGADIEPLLDRYRGIAGLAPATVAPEWAELVTTMETASTVVPGDDASIDRAIDAALAGQPAYTRIQQYTSSVCGLAIGTPPTPTNPVTATTPAPSTTEEPASETATTP